MNSKLLSIILIVAVVLVAGCTQGGQQSTPSPSKSQAVASSPTATPKVPATSLPSPSISNPATTLRATPTPPASQTAASVKTFTNDITHSGYSWKDGTGTSVNTLTVNKGDTVKILATSTPPAHKHGITIDAFSVNTEVTASPGSTPQEISFTADKTGTFEIYCKTCIDGAQGAHGWMKASLVVQ